MGKKKSHKEFVEELKVVQPNVEVIGLYINTNTPLACRCKTLEQWNEFLNSLK